MRYYKSFFKQCGSTILPPISFPPMGTKLSNESLGTNQEIRRGPGYGSVAATCAPLLPQSDEYVHA